MVVGISMPLVMHVTYFIVIIGTCYNWAFESVLVAGMRSVPTATTTATTTPMRLPVSPRYRNNRMRRSVAALNSGNGTHAKTGVLPDEFSYVLTLGLGTPPTNLSLTMDTGSEFAWTQCQPCQACYQQHDPTFDPSHSRTYSAIPCSSDTCNTLGQSKANCDQLCQFAVYYLDGSQTAGDFAQDALWINGKVLSESYPIGCGHFNYGLFDDSDGIIGFNLGPLSFPAQAKLPSFAYCLTDPFNGTSADNPFSLASTDSNSAGYLTFPVSPSDAGNCTTLLTNQINSYVIQLDSVTVNDQKLNFSSGIIVDSGTVLTRLPYEFYERFRDEFVRGMHVSPLPRSDLSFFDTCYNASVVAHDGKLMQLPSVSLTFADGLNFTLPNENLLFGPSNELGSGSHYCLAFLPSHVNDTTTILGSFQQKGHQFTFDIANNKVCIVTHHKSC